MITKSIIIHLSKYLNMNDKDFFRLKYIHIAYITKMATHQGVELLDSHACSSHSLGTNQ